MCKQMYDRGELTEEQFEDITNRRNNIKKEDRGDVVIQWQSI